MAFSILYIYMNTLYNKHISEYIRSHFGLKTLDVATEFLDLVTSQYISDLTCWGAIRAQTTESQVHREMRWSLGNKKSMCI